MRSQTGSARRYHVCGWLSRPATAEPAALGASIITTGTGADGGIGGDSIANFGTGGKGGNGGDFSIGATGGVGGVRFEMDGQTGKVG